MGKIIVQCVNAKCFKKLFLFDFGQAKIAPSLSFAINCPHCGEINILSFSVTANKTEELPVWWAVTPNLIFKLPDAKEKKNDSMGRDMI